MSHEWGNYPEDFTPKMYWGARAILERESDQPGKALYLLYDRQSFEQLEGSQRDQDAFFSWINTKVLPELRHLARENRFHEWTDLATIQSEDGSFVCQATPKGSYGEYLYIGCWEVEQTSTVIDKLSNDEEESQCNIRWLNTWGWICGGTERPQVKTPMPPQLHPAQTAITVLPIRGMHLEWGCLILSKRSVRVHPNGTMKKRSIRVGFRLLVRPRLEAGPNGTLTFL